MATVGDVRNKLCGSPFIVRNETPANELSAYREKAIHLLNELKNTPKNDGGTSSMAAGPTAKTFALYRETLAELESLVSYIDLTLSALNAPTAADTCTVLYKWMGWPIDDVSCLSRKQQKALERNTLIRASFEVGLLVSSLAGRSRFFSSVEARERRSAIGRDSVAQINADHIELHSKYQSAVVERMATTDDSYSKACEYVASSFGVSERTVRDHTTNPKPRNRGRWRG